MDCDVKKVVRKAFVSGLRSLFVESMLNSRSNVLFGKGGEVGWFGCLALCSLCDTSEHIVRSSHIIFHQPCHGYSQCVSLPVLWHNRPFFLSIRLCGCSVNNPLPCLWHLSFCPCSTCVKVARNCLHVGFNPCQDWGPQGHGRSSHPKQEHEKTHRQGSG